MGRPLYTNNAASSLAFGITTSSTSIQVVDGMGTLFPTPTSGDYFYCTLTSISTGALEIVKCTARSGDVFTVVRGQEGTTAQAYNMGDNVQLRITAAGMNYITGASGSITAEETQTATAGQTVFTLTTIDYSVGTNNIAVFVNGSKQISGVNFNETSVNVVTFVNGLNVGDVVEFVVGASFASGTAYATDINYVPPFTNSVQETVQAKLSQTVSVKDFGAVGDGTTDDTTAIQNALTASSNVYFPAGTYLVSSTLVVNTTYQGIVKLIGAGKEFTNLNWVGSTSGLLLTNSTRGGIKIEDISFVNTVAIGSTACIAAATNAGFEYSNIKNCLFNGFNVAIGMGTVTGSDSYFNTIEQNLFISCGYGVYLLGTPTNSLPCNSNWIKNNKFYNCGNGIYIIDGATTCDFSFNSFEGTTTNGIYANVNDCTFINNHFEVGAGNSINLVSGLNNFIVSITNQGGSGTFINNGTSTTIFSSRTNETQIPVEYLSFPSTVTEPALPAGNTTLWDYRQNQTFTPVLNNWTNVGTPTVTGTYTKIGNIVFINISIIPSTSVSSIAATSYITGLPYTPSNTFACSAVNVSTIASYGSGEINSYSGGSVYIGTTGTVTNTIVISGFYTIS